MCVFIFDDTGSFFSDNRITHIVKPDKVLALMGNHEEFVMYGYSTINHMSKTLDEENSVDESEEDKYIQWMKNIQLKLVSTSIG